MFDPTIPTPTTLPSSDTLVNKEVYDTLLNFYKSVVDADRRWAFIDNDRFTTVVNSHIEISKTNHVFERFLQTPRG